MVHLQKKIKRLQAQIKRMKREERAEVKRPKRHIRVMPRRTRTRTIVRHVRRGGRRARGMLGGAKGIFHKVAGGVGGGVVAEAITDRVYPSASPIAGLAGAWIGGGMFGVVAKVAFDAISGKGGLLAGFGLGSTSTRVDSL